MQLPNEIGKHFFRKITQEMILWQKGMDCGQYQESFLVISPDTKILDEVSKVLQILGNYFDGYRKMEKNIDYLTSNMNFYKGATLIEVPKKITANIKSQATLKAQLTNKKERGRLSPRSRKYETIYRTWVYVMTSNKIRCIPKELAGRRTIPYFINRRAMYDVVGWTGKNVEQIFAQSFYELEKNGYKPTYPCLFDKYVDMKALQRYIIPNSGYDSRAYNG